MELNLHVVRERLEGRFPLGSGRLSPERGFHHVKCYLGQRELDGNALYLVDKTRRGAFAAAAGTGACSAVAVGWQGEDLPAGTLYIAVEGEGETLLLEVLTEVQTLFDQLRAWELRLTELRGRGRPLREFLQVGYEVIGNPMMLYDQNYLISATTQGIHAPPEDVAWKAQVAAGYWTPELRSVVRAENWHGQKNRASYYDTNNFEHNGVIVSYSHQARFLGTLFVMEYFSRVTPGQIHLIQCFADLLRRELLESQRSGSENLSDTDSFFRMVLFADSSSFTDEFINRRLGELGWRGQDRYCVLVFADMFHQQRHQYMPEHIHRRFPGSYCLEVEDRLVTVVRLEDGGEEDITEQLAELVRDSVMKCGISDILPNFLGISYGYRQALAALSIGEMLDPTFWYYRYGDYAVEHVVNYALQAARLETFCHRAILALDKEDRENGTQYVSTLEAYLSGGGNLKKVADCLHMHRNTLQYRLNRIAQLAGVDYRDEQELKRLYLSIKLLRVYRASPPAGEKAKREN